MNMGFFRIKCGIVFAVLLCSFCGGAWGETEQLKTLFYLDDLRNDTLQIVAMRLDETGAYQKHKEMFKRNLEGDTLFRDAWLATNVQGTYFFYTYGESNLISIVDARTMQPAGTVRIPGVTSCAGVVYDDTKGCLYCLARGTDQLYGFVWAEQFQQLTPMVGSPFQLHGATGHGLALDESRGILYVANRNEVIRSYHTADWSIERQIQLSRPALCVEVDAKNQMLYTGGGYMLDYSLVQYDLLFDIERSIPVDPWKGVAGLAMDYEKEWLYVTTGTIYGGDNYLLAYDITLERRAEQNLGSWPRDVVINGSTSGYNPLGLKHTIVEGASSLDGQFFAGPGDVVIYETRFGNQRFGQSIQNVTARNALPPELRFIRAESETGALGVYEPATHSYMLRLPQLLSGEEQIYRLVCQVVDDVSSEVHLRHSVEVSSVELAPTTRYADLTVRYSYENLGLTKALVSGITDVDGTYYTEPGSDVVYELAISNELNPWGVTGVVLIDQLPPELQYVGLEGPGDVNAVYHPDNHTLVYSLAELAGGIVHRLQYKMHVPAGTADDAFAVNVAAVDSEQTDLSQAQVGLVITKSIRALDLDVTLISSPPPSDPPRVQPGQQLVYEITATNRNSFTTVTDVIVRTELSNGLSILQADPNNGIFDGQTYTWHHIQLSPGQSVSYRLDVQVDHGLEGGTPLVADVQAYTAQTPTARELYTIYTVPQGLRTVATAVTSAGDVILPGTVGCILAGEVYNYRVVVGNPNNAGPVNNVVVQVTLAPEVIVRNVDPEGSYDPVTHSVFVNIPILITGQDATVDVQVEARGDLPIGYPFSTHISVFTEDAPPYQTTIDTRICDKGIEVDRTEVVYNPAYPENQIIVILTLPLGIQMEEVDVVKGLILNPGQVTDLMPLIGGGGDAPVQMRGFFDPVLVWNVTGPGPVEVTIEGYLRNGRRFVGSGQIVFPD